MRWFLTALFLTSAPAMASDADRAVIDAVLDRHVLPGFSELATTSDELATAAERSCAPEDAALRAAFHVAFDAWVSVSHLRFGPTETDNRAFALAFWPDSRGATPKTLARLIADQDPVVDEAAAFATLSIAARGFYALEFLLFDPGFQAPETAAYQCQLIRAATRDIAATSDAIAQDWAESYADQMRAAGPDALYRSDAEVLQEFYKALSGGLQFTSDARLGRPMGSFEKPRPKRAEARRSGRSLRHVQVSLHSLNELAELLAGAHPEVRQALNDAFAKARQNAEQQEDPVFGGVVTPLGRLKVEVLQQSVDAIRLIAAERLGPTLGVDAGFNALDGD